MSFGTAVAVLAFVACGRFGADAERAEDPDAAADGVDARAKTDAKRVEDVVSDEDAIEAATPRTCANGGATCAAWEACEDDACVPVAAALNGLRYELRCIDDGRPVCNIKSAHPADRTVTLTGTEGKSYDLVVRIRGVVEQHTYQDDSAGPAVGKNAEFFTQGGSSDPLDTWNIYELRISAPAWTWHLNSGTTGNTFCDVVDYEATIRADANATLLVHSDSGDPGQANNQGAAGSTTPVSAPGLPVFAGQFLQFDLVGVTPAVDR